MGDSEESKQEESRRTSKLWTPGGDSEAAGAGAEPPEQPEEISDEELRRRIEEAMEKITVTDVVVDMMVSLSSLAYQKMGIPHEVNEKYRDLEQARMAIDCLDALLKTLEGRLPEDVTSPLTGALDSLKLNFARES